MQAIVPILHNQLICVAYSIFHQRKHHLYHSPYFRVKFWIRREHNLALQARIRKYCYLRSLFDGCSLIVDR